MKNLLFRLASAFAVVGLVGALHGCAGYQLGSVKPEIYSGIEKIHVPPFKNLTLEPRLSSLVTNAVLKKLQADGTYRISDRRNCDAVLVGTIRDVDRRQLRSARLDTLRSRQLNLYLFVDWHLEDPASGEQLGYATSKDKAGAQRGRNGVGKDSHNGRPGTVIGTTIQFVDSNFQLAERNALAVAALDAASKLVSQLADGW